MLEMICIFCIPNSPYLVLLCLGVLVECEFPP